MQYATVIIARKCWDCIKWVEVDYFWLKEKEEQKQQQTTTSTMVSGHGWKPGMPMIDADHVDETLGIIDNLCADETQASLKQVLQNG